MNRNNPWILFTSIIITSIGLITLLSTELNQYFTLSIDNIFVKQLIFIILGFLLMQLMSRFDYQLLKYKPIIYALYLFNILLLLITIFFGESVNGAQRWIKLPGFQFQPSEFSKIVVIVVTAYLYETRESIAEWKILIISGLVTLPVILLVFLQPHGSMAIILGLLWAFTSFVMMKDQVRNILLIIIFTLIFIGIFAISAFGNYSFLILSGIGIIIAIFTYFARDYWKLPVVIATVVAIGVGGAGSLIWNSALDDYQRNRVMDFQSLMSDDNSSFNVEQSRIAIGSGGIWGKGFNNGTQSKLNYLPFHQTDFIFAAYSEIFGLVGALVLLVLYFILFWNIFIFPVENYSFEFENGIVLGIGVKILLELVINLGTNIGISPATGIPLPLLSAGGTITLLTFFSLGIIQSIMYRIKNIQKYVD